MRGSQEVMDDFVVSTTTCAVLSVSGVLDTLVRAFATSFYLCLNFIICSRSFMCWLTGAAIFNLLVGDC